MIDMRTDVGYTLIKTHNMYFLSFTHIHRTHARAFLINYNYAAKFVNM